MKQKLTFVVALFAALTAFSTEYYVDASRPDDSGAATNWATAKQTIQAAVGLTVDGDTVWVTNGVYDAGGMVAPTYSVGDPLNALTNRVCVTNAITVCSVNGADVTVIRGQGPMGSSAVRCVYLSSGSSMAGFTLVDGYTLDSWSEGLFDSMGGGAIVLSNSALTRCILEDNSALYGGGAFLWGGTLNNCCLIGNFSEFAGGGACLDHGGMLNNCTVSENVSMDGGGVYVPSGTLNNCVVWDNSKNNIFIEDAVILYTCSDPLLPGEGNISADPLFKNPLSNFRLKQSSPCIDAGSNLYAPSNDLVGVLRPFDGDTNGVATADMGCYEWDLSSLPRTYYVDASRPDDSGVATNWATAKRTIQAAVDLATDEDTVLVTNGVYDAGGAVAPVHILPGGYYSVTNSLTNRLCITKEITVRSINGVAATIIQGASDDGVANLSAVRCAYLLSGAVLEGFTLEGGGLSGGGAWIDAYGGGAVLTTNSILNRCVIRGNSAQVGGGVLCHGGGLLNNCLVVGNTAQYGGGVALEYGALNNCTVVGNTATDTTGGVDGQHAVLSNCIIWGNSGPYADNIDLWDTTIRYTCSDSLLPGDGNISADPLFKNSLSNFRLKQGSPCIDAGLNDYALTTDLDGMIRPFDGDTNGVATADMGCYEWNLSSMPRTYYVDASRPDDSGAATNWATAKRTIQAAVDSATDEDTVLVTNGVYDAGGAVAPDGYYPEFSGFFESCLTNRVCVTNAITVQSVNGADVTMIQGASDNGALGLAAARCVYLSCGAVVDGFCLAGGHTLSGSDGGGYFAPFGGGAVVLANSVLKNCKITSNRGYVGGGVQCEQGGKLNNCLISGNVAANCGGAVVSGGTLTHCTVIDNFAQVYTDSGSDEFGGSIGGLGINGGFLNNCIVWDNYADVAIDNIHVDNSVIRYTCSDPLQSGAGNINMDPFFVDEENDDFHLQLNSPCVNAGDENSISVTNDLGGYVRIVGGVVDMGAYENQDAGTDADDDGMSDLWELDLFGGRHFASPSTVASNGVNTLLYSYIAGLDPKDPDSRFDMMMPSARNLQWSGVSGRVYSVYCSTNLIDGFQPLETNIPWTAGSFTDTNHVGNGQMFYKIGVELAP